MSKHDLVTTEDAAEQLGVDEAEVDELLKNGELRKVWHRAGNDSEAELEAFVMGADVKRLKRESSPTYLAKVAAGEVIEDDDEGNPRSLAESVPRL